MQQRLLNLNPHSFRKMVTSLLEANGRGYWETSEENLDRLRQLYQEVEDRIEGGRNKPFRRYLETRFLEETGFFFAHGLRQKPAIAL